MRPTGTTVAWLLAAATAVAMLTTSTAPRVVLVLLLAGLQLGLHLLAARDRAISAWRRPPVLFSVQAGLTWLVAGTATTTSVVAYLVVGLLFALVAEVVLRVVGRHVREDAAPRPADTAPLPVADEG